MSSTRTAPGFPRSGVAPMRRADGSPHFTRGPGADPAVVVGPRTVAPCADDE
ncbi:hypothetical protein ACFVJH_04520 [Streptomyces decoyicus]|uniref:hypothetical protein n=1 Tax=Streptomyces decoyicus TaxID=249567 RepID=UPI003633278C